MKRRQNLNFLVLLFLVAIQVMLLIGCSTQETQDVKIPEAQANVYVYDEDGLFDQSTEEKLNNMLIGLEEKTDAEFAVVTIKSLNGLSIEDYSIKVANGLGIGKKGEDNGVLLIMSKSDKRVRLEIGKGLEGILTDSKSGKILDEFFVPHREKGEYVEATTLTVQAVVNVIAKDKQVSIDGVDQDVKVSESKPISGETVALIIGIIILIIIILIIINHYTDGAIVEFLYIFTSSDDSSSGGGSSGGGFGGGSFGGGGASR